MGPIFKFLIIVFLFFLIIRLLFKVFVPNLFKNFVRKVINEDKNTNDYITEEKRKEGQIIIKKTSKQKNTIAKNSNDEYIDFEEIND